MAALGNRLRSGHLGRSGMGFAGSEHCLAKKSCPRLLLPAKKGIAAGQAEAAKLRVATEILDLVVEVKTAYFRLEADQAIGALLHDPVSAADAAGIARQAPARRG